jgi:hypothetical protein
MLAMRAGLLDPEKNAQVSATRLKLPSNRWSVRPAHS